MSDAREPLIPSEAPRPVRRFSEADSSNRADSHSADDGDMVAVWLRDENETTLKRFYPEGSTVRLQPANNQMDPIRVPADNVEVLSRLVAVWRFLG